MSASAVETRAVTERSAIDLAAAIRAGELRSREVVDAHIELIERRNPSVNAIVANRFEAARAEADAADAKVAAGDEARSAARRPLHDQGVVRRRGPAAHLGLARSQGGDRRALRHRGRAAGRRRRDRPRGHQHLGADAVDRVREPGLGSHRQRLRQHSHRGRFIGGRGRCRRLRVRADRPRDRHRRLDSPAGLLQRRLRPQADRLPGSAHRPLPGAERSRLRDARLRPARAPRRGPDAVPAGRRRARWDRRDRAIGRAGRSGRSRPLRDARRHVRRRQPDPGLARAAKRADRRGPGAARRGRRGPAHLAAGSEERDPAVPERDARIRRAA